MLIVYKFNFKLPVIGFLIVLRRVEKLHDIILGEQGTSEDAHDLHDWASKLEVVLNDSDETVGDECNRVNVIFVFYLPSATKSLGTPVYKGVLRWWQMGGRWQQKCTLTVLKPIVFCRFP